MDDKDLIRALANDMTMLKCVKCKSRGNLVPYKFTQKIITESKFKRSSYRESFYFKSAIVFTCSNCAEMFENWTNKKYNRSKMNDYIYSLKNSKNPHKYIEFKNERLYIKPENFKRWILYTDWIKDSLDDFTSAPKFCSNCGVKLEIDQKFCTNCGAQIKQ